MLKPIALGLSSLLGVGLAGIYQGPPGPPGEEPPPPPKKKAAGDELRKSYNLLRKVRADGGGVRTEERIKDWTDRATELYRQAVKATEDGDRRRGREIGVAAHDLARAVDHARNAARLDRPDPDLPPPPASAGPEDVGERTRRDLFRAYERIRSAPEYGPEADAKFYLDGARDLYNAARRDMEAGREERAGELARAAEAMTHVPEHLSHATVDDPDDGPAGKEFDPEPKKKGDPKKKAGPRDEFAPAPDARGERTLPPPLP
ncbi:hypothetical protein [Paludisphaera rhizosphaerae]|uniref:hypothetical protein n=1 Tax=Paludisphaera rhizosphaerae TaxID=2711216 RepID=UPI0013EB6CAC|nr:hypothetical protein [Paludisphaera rhizosphaerae]